MKVPDGTDYLENHADGRGPVSRQQRWMIHVALLVPDIQHALEEAQRRMPAAAGATDVAAGGSQQTLAAEPVRSGRHAHGADGTVPDALNGRRTATGGTAGVPCGAPASSRWAGGAAAATARPRRAARRASRPCPARRSPAHGLVDRRDLAVLADVERPAVHEAALAEHATPSPSSSSDRRAAGSPPCVPRRTSCCLRPDRRWP